MARNTFMQDEILEQEFNSKQLFRILKYMLPHIRFVICVCIMIVLATVAGLVTPILHQLIIDKFIPSNNISLIVYLMLGMIMLNLLDITMQYLQTKHMGILGHKIIYDIRRDVFFKMQTLSFDYFDNRPAGKIAVRVTSYIDELANFFANVLINFVMNIFKILVVIIFMFSLNWMLALVVLATIIPLMGVIMLLRKLLKKRFMVMRNKGSNRTAYLYENVQGSQITKEYNRTKANSKIQDVIAEQATTSWCNIIQINELFFPSVEFFWNLGSLALYALAFYAINANPVFGASVGIESVGIVVAFISYMSLFNGPLNQLSTVFQQLAQVSSNLERVFELVDTDPIIEDSIKATPIDDIKGDVNFENITFSYDESKVILKDFNLNVKAGECIALVGPTGAGKSTIINLISRFYDVQNGRVLIDGIDVKDITIHSLRSQMGVMMQDTFLFKGTIMDNIRYGKPDANEEEIIEAAKGVFVHDLIMRKADGYNTSINGLSTGEKQLISFARVMLSNPKIIILDEATSSIDTETEIKIQKAMNAILKGRTSFMIAHRLSTIRNADRILYIDKQNIMESGTHSELMEKKGLYYDLNTRQ